MSKITKAITNPLWAISRIKNKYYTLPTYEKLHKKSFIKIAEEFFSFNIDEYHQFSKEILTDNDFNTAVNKEYNSCGINKKFPNPKYSWPILLYCLIRKYKPSTIVETGCWYGVSTSHILAAIHKNNHGNLYTIDKPALRETGGYYDTNPYIKEEERTEYLPDGKSPGFLVPENLKTKWKIIYGETKNELPNLFKELGNADFFIHDSLHSYENMIFEFELAAKYVKKGGFIFSDNIDWNTAFDDFYKKNNLKNSSYLAYYETPKLRYNFGSIAI